MFLNDSQHCRSFNNSQYCIKHPVCLASSNCACLPRHQLFRFLMFSLLLLMYVLFLFVFFFVLKSRKTIYTYVRLHNKSLG